MTRFHRGKVCLMYSEYFKLKYLLALLLVNVIIFELSTKQFPTSGGRGGGRGGIKNPFVLGVMELLLTRIKKIVKNEMLEHMCPRG